MDEYKKLQLALISNDLEKLKSEIKSVTDINAVNLLGMNILHYYISAADKLKYDPKVIISLLIEKGIDINAQTKKEKLTPLRYALAHKNESIFKILMGANADFELPGAEGNTTLWRAVMDNGGQPVIANIVKMLLKAGADPYRANDHGIAPIHIVSDTGKAIDEGTVSKDYDLRPIFVDAGFDITKSEKTIHASDRSKEKKLKVFYWNSYEDKGAPYDNPINLTLKDATEYMELLPDSDGSFLGLILPNKTIVQFIYDDNHKLSLDIPDVDRLGSFSKPITLNQCIDIIRSTYSGKNPHDLKTNFA